MKNLLPLAKKLLMASFIASLSLYCGSCAMTAGTPSKDGGEANKNIQGGPGNPYLPMWEHVPDGEPRVFEDPDHPGKFRVYIIGSHDVSFRGYCGPDIRAWSAPVEDLSAW